MCARGGEQGPGNGHLHLAETKITHANARPGHLGLEDGRISRKETDAPRLHGHHELIPPAQLCANNAPGELKHAVRTDGHVPISTVKQHHLGIFYAVGAGEDQSLVTVRPRPVDELDADGGLDRMPQRRERKLERTMLVGDACTDTVFSARSLVEIEDFGSQHFICKFSFALYHQLYFEGDQTSQQDCARRAC